MFTQDQLNFLNQLIDDRIAHHAQSNHQASQSSPFHTIYAIRRLILEHLDEFESFCLGGEFHIATLTSFLKHKTKLSPLDQELLSQGRNGNPVTRFETQVQSCFTNWRHAPIERATRRGYYQFVKSPQAQQ